MDYKEKYGMEYDVKDDNSDKKVSSDSCYCCTAELRASCRIGPFHSGLYVVNWLQSDLFC